MAPFKSLIELKEDLSVALRSNDISALEQLAFDFDALGTKDGAAAAERARGLAQVYAGNNTKALEHAQRSLKMYAEISDRLGIAQAHGDIGSICLESGDIERAHEFLQRALALHGELDNTKGRAAMYSSLGNLYRMTGDFTRSLENHYKALELNEELGYDGGIAMSLSNLGMIYSAIGDYPQSIDFGQRALALNEELGQRSGMARTNTNIGNVYSRIGNHTLALEYHKRSLDLSRELGLRRSEAVALGNIGVTYAEMEDIDSALDYFRQSVELNESLGEGYTDTLSYLNLAVLLIDLGSIDEAQQILENLSAKTISDPTALMQLEECHAMIEEHHGNLDKAVLMIMQALATAEKHSIPRQQAVFHFRLRDLAKKRNDFAGYIEHNDAYTRIIEEINGKETATKLAMQEAERTMAKERERERIERERIANEREREQAILYSTLPKHIADRVIRGESVNDHIDNASVIFVDIVGFTTLSSTLTSQEIASLLDAVFGICDDVCSNNATTRIKTIGDSYMAFSH